MKVATDSTFFTAAHVGPISQTVSGGGAGGCVFTHFGAAGNIISDNNHCQGWTSISMTDSADVGDTGQIDNRWAFTTVFGCDTQCFVYCIQQ